MTRTETPDDAVGAAQGLRERSKAKRRVAIQHAAMRLFAERGYEATTLADIAAEAEVAVRTVTGYFGSKADLALSYADDIAVRLEATFAAHPAQDPLDIIDIWLTSEEESFDRETRDLAAAMLVANPELRALGDARIEKVAEQGRSAFNRRIGLPGDHPMVLIAISAVGAALATYLSVMERHDDYPALHQSFMKYLRASADAARPAESAP